MDPRHPNPDPSQSVTDPQHWFSVVSFFLLSVYRFATDQLKHEYGVVLVNVFDTMLFSIVSIFVQVRL